MRINSKPEKFYKNGIAFFEKGDYDNAIDCFSKAHELKPNNVVYAYDLALTYLKKGDYDSSIEKFEACLKLNPNDYDTCYNLGMAYAEKEDYDSAINAYKKASNLKPRYYSCYDNIGTLYYNKGEYKLALENYKKSASLAPTNNTVLYNLAYTYYVLEDWNKAEQAFSKVLSLNNSDEEACFNLGNIYLKKKQYEYAVKSYELAIENCPDHEESLKALELAKELLVEELNSEKEKEVVVEKEELIVEEVVEELDPVEKTDNEANPEEFLKQEDGLEYQLETHIEEVCAEIFIQGKSYIEKGDLNNAAKSLAEVLEHNKNNNEAKDLLTKVEKLLSTSKSLVEKSKELMKKDTIDESIELLKQASRITPCDNSIKGMLEYALSEQNKELEKKKRIYLGSSNKLLKQGDYTSAKLRLDDYISLNPSCPEGHMTLGKVYMGTKEYNSAIDSLKTSLSINPNSQETQEMLFNAVKFVNENKDEAQGYMQHVKLNIQKNEHDKAISSLKTLLEKSPDDLRTKEKIDEMINILICEKSSLNQDSTAFISNITDSMISNLNKIKEDPNDPEAHYNLAVIYLKQKNYDYAIENIRKTLEIEPENKKAQDLLFDIYRRTNT